MGANSKLCLCFTCKCRRAKLIHCGTPQLLRDGNCPRTAEPCASTDLNLGRRSFRLRTVKWEIHRVCGTQVGHTSCSPNQFLSTD